MPLVSGQKVQDRGAGDGPGTSIMEWWCLVWQFTNSLIGEAVPVQMTDVPLLVARCRSATG